MNYLRVICGFIGLSIAVAVMADVPVVDLSQGQNATASQNTLSQAIAGPMQQSLSLDQRVARLEQQINNLVQMNLPNEISEVQQQIQQLTGQLQVQQHDLKLLNEQQRNFYQDLDQRLSNLQALVTAGNTSSSSATSVLPASIAAAKDTSKNKTTAEKNSSRDHAINDETD